MKRKRSRRRTSTSPEARRHRAAKRQERLEARLVRRLLDRERELMDIIDCMDGDAHWQPHATANPFDQWELAELARRRRDHLPYSAYRADRLMHYVP
jgi:hypothetical protein